MRKKEESLREEVARLREEFSHYCCDVAENGGSHCSDSISGLLKAGGVVDVSSSNGKGGVVDSSINKTKPEPNVISATTKFNNSQREEQETRSFQ